MQQLNNERLAKLVAQIQSLHTDLTTAYNMLSPMLRFDKDIPAHAHLTYQTFCVFIGDIRKQIESIHNELTKPSTE